MEFEKIRSGCGVITLATFIREISGFVKRLDVSDEISFELKSFFAVFAFETKSSSVCVVMRSYLRIYIYTEDIQGVVSIRS